MDRETFQNELHRANSLMAENPEYWRAYCLGLRRRFYGENYGTDHQHASWMNFGRGESGRGYQAGYNLVALEKAPGI